MSGAANRVGAILASKYRLEELLGSGGMGHVYRAVNEDVGRAVAIKVLRSEHATNAPIVERFLREAKAANLVRHPNVVDVLDIGRDADGSPFIVQELLRGQDLSKYVEHRGGKLTLRELEEYCLPVIDAVAEAHAHGVVHRDIKPENVFLAEQGKQRIPKLLDFGISKIRLPDIRATEVGMMMGTPAYMAPEQIQGARDADPRSDVWALGVMLFELIAGRLPFDAQDAPALFVAIATRDVPRLVDIAPGTNPDVSRIVERCLRRQPDERYPTALELGRDFRHALDGTELEPTQRVHLSARPPPLAPALEIPDLALPRRPERSDARDKSVPTAVGAAPSPSAVPDLALGKTEIAARPKATPAIPADAPAATRLDTPRAAPPPAPAAPLPPPPSTRAAAAPRASLPLDGVMMGPGVAPSHRRPPVGLRADAPAAPPPPDLSFLVGIAVVGLVAIGATAVAMTFGHQPEGLAVVGYVTKPTPTLSLAVQGALGLLAFVFAARFAIGGVRRWRDEVEGGRAAAIVMALVAGGLFFLALELARAAW